MSVDPGAEPALAVEDDGPGIAEEDRGRIFEPFVRVGEPETPGSGLGLALVAQQARAHGAQIEVGTSELGGARFTCVSADAVDRPAAPVVGGSCPSCVG